MRLIGSFSDFDVYKRDDLNIYIKFHESGVVYTIMEDETMVKINQEFAQRLLLLLKSR